jgi:Na+/H+ antiporter NhaD/arsenite permease-like protein
VSLAFGLPVAAYFLGCAPRELLHAVLEYASFIMLLAALFIVSGGILLNGTIRATQGINCAFLVVGAVMANVLGTTGASMLLIRPLLRANAGRKRVSHVVIFFIFIVANIGGSLTAIGDPPLFLGYLRGVPFFWPLLHLGPIWLFTCGIVIGIFYVVDRREFALEQVAAEGDGSTPVTIAPATGERVPFSIEGKVNILLLGGVIAAVFLPAPWRETAMMTAAAVSVWKTPAGVREKNEFTYHPIKEVAILFAGIFASMIPALLILKARGGGLGVTEPVQFFWATGLLSSFLDNAPTYLTFFVLGQSLGGTDLVASVPVPLLAAISMGAVFMGANTYIGNAPNFMVKAIAEEGGVRMAS